MSGTRYDIDFDDPKLLADLIKTMIENTPVAYIVLDKGYRVHFMNGYFLRMRKLCAAEVMGRRCFDISNKGVPCPVCAVREAISSGKGGEVLRKDVLPDGTVRYMDDKAVPLYKDGGRDFDQLLEVMIDRSRVMQLRNEADRILYDIIQTLVSVLNKKDAYTSHHSADVSSISAKLARFMGLDEDEVYRIALGALLHDIGKVYVPDKVINKPSGLDEDEFALIRRHPDHSFHLLKDLKSFDDIKEICLRHHERWDGKGYPGGLSDAENPLGACIVGLADTYDAMTSERSYRKGLPHEQALAEVEKNLGGQFSPLAGRQFLEMAATLFPSREALITKDDNAIHGHLQKRKEANQVVRQIQAPIAESQHTAFSPQGEVSFDDKFIHLIFQHTPAYYTIISEAFDILWASDSLAKAVGAPDGKSLTSGKCFEVNGKNMDCFRMRDGTMACPVVRAFHSGKEQTGVTTERFGDSVKHFDIYAVPLEIPDRHGNTVRCAMEIMFDRTDEVNTRQDMEQDIQSLIRTLEGLISELDPTVTGNSQAIIRECGSFGEFVTRFRAGLAEKYGRAE